MKKSKNRGAADLSLKDRNQIVVLKQTLIHHPNKYSTLLKLKEKSKLQNIIKKWYNKYRIRAKIC